MTSPTPRIRLSDAVLLMAATCVGFAWTRYNTTNVLARDFESRIYKAESPHMLDCYPIPRGWRGAWRYVSMTWVCVESALPCLAAWTVAVPILYRNRRRPPGEQATDQLGFVACCAAGLVLIVSGVGNSVTMHVHDIFYWIENHQPSPYPEHYWPNLTNFIKPEVCGIGVICACAAMTAGGHVRPVRDWLDRAGRILGMVWAIMVPISWVGRWLGQ
ncbi:MAG: hypothetical protein U0835_01050 [Isosphaeraceae bacterium]